MMAGAGLLMVNWTAVEVPPPGAGVVTVTLATAAVAISAAAIEAVSCVPFTKVVAFAAPLKFTVEVVAKPVPFTVRTKAGPPTMALVGDRVVIEGGAAVLVKENGAGAATPATVALTI